MQHASTRGRPVEVGWRGGVRSLPAAALIALAVLAADYLTGPFIQFPILFIAPIALAAWFHGRRWGLAFAVLLPGAHMAISLVHRVPWSLLDSWINALIRVLVFGLFSHLMDQAAQRRRLAEEVQVLRGLLPICSFCKRIRNADGKWEVLEQYIADRSEAEFSHGICAPCARKHYHVDVKE
jgi:hypothetical protein